MGGSRVCDACLNMFARMLVVIVLQHGCCCGRHARTVLPMLAWLLIKSFACLGGCRTLKIQKHSTPSGALAVTFGWLGAKRSTAKATMDPTLNKLSELQYLAQFAEA
ncbi:unnamed protein product [Symbiodinium natans]|uniref:Uncharacterized protein n=1 Tax=Symbiodinium natans TaxID=878477 RepID=A0A812RN68_9DINO|nr:unnamed protein product [Symbiodinium natans]